MKNCVKCNEQLGDAAKVCYRCNERQPDENESVADELEYESTTIITTTNSIEGEVIEKYLGIVSDRLVIGAGLFSEFFAGFTDVFGGRSAKFEDRMNELYNQLMKSLEWKARALDADAIVGLSIDMDEISGKNSQMFMISGVGTAVKFKSRME